MLKNIKNLDERYISNKLERTKSIIIRKIAKIYKNKTLKNNFSSLTEKHLLEDIFDIDEAYYKIIEILSLKNINESISNKTLSSDSDLLTDALILLATLKLNPIDQKNTNLQSLVYDIFGLNEFKNNFYDGTNYANRELDYITLQKQQMINLPINIISRSYSQLLYSLIFDIIDLTYFFYFYKDDSIISLATSKKAINSLHYLFLLYIFNVEV